MRFSLINKNNIIVTIIEADSYAMAKNNENYDEQFILVPAEEHHVKGLDLNTYKPMSTKEKIDKGMIKLESNQVYDDKNDYIITLTPDQEYRDGEIVMLNLLEQYEKGVLTEEEYIERTNANRQAAYQETTDKQVVELMRSYLNSNKSKLNAEQKALLDKINNAVAEIKENNPKATTQETENTTQETAKTDKK